MVRMLVVFSLMFFTDFGQAQERADQIPTYTHLTHKDLPTVFVNLATFSVNTEDLTIAIATDPQGNVYTLSFGKGVDKRDADGNLLNGDFINGLKSPMDIAIDRNGLIYIADFEASGENYLDNGQIKIYDPQGNYLRSILTSYFRPLGVDVDEEFIYIAEHNDGKQGPESTPSSRVRKINKVTETVVAVNNSISLPYRIAANSLGQVFVSKAGDTPAVLILSEDLTIQGQLPNIQSPGSVVVDVFDYVHVIEYSGRIDFSRFINFEELSLGEIQDIAEDIDNGIDAEAFGIKVFDPSLSLQHFFKEMIDFPVDVVFNDCDRMYVNNGDMFGGNIIFFGYVPEKMEFDLEIYQRTPSADITPPVATCVAPFTVTLDSNGTASITVDDVDNNSTDNCGIENRTLSQYDFTTADIGVVPVTLTITDTSGLPTTCVVNVTIEAASGPEPPEAVCEDLTVYLDANGSAVITAAQVYDGGDTSLDLNIDVSSFDCNNLGENPVILTVTDPATGLSDTCTAQITVVDNTPPEVSCVAPFTLTLGTDGTASLTVDDIEDTSSDNCGIASRTLSKYDFTSADIGVVPVTLTITDTSGLPATCVVNVTVEAAAGPEPPEAVCNDLTITLDQNGVATITASEVYDGTDSSLDLGIDVSSFDCNNLGENPVILTVTDPATGLSDTCTAQITVVDNTPPEVSCVAPFTLTLGNDGTASLTVDDIDDGSSDNCTIADRALSRYDFTSADIGVVPVTLTVTDSSGLPATCVVNVTVAAAAGPEPPEAVCEDLTVALDQNGLATITASEVYGGNDTSLDLYIDVSSFDCSTLGGNPVILTVTDPATGLSDTCTAQITVVDNIVPVANCVTHVPQFRLVNGSVTLDPTDLNDGSADNCSELNFSLSEDTFTTPGIKQVTLTVRDASDNFNECTTSVEILPEAVTGEISCKSTTLYLDNNGDAALDPAAIYDGDANDPEIENLEVDRINFDCEDVGQTFNVQLTVTYTDGTAATCTGQVKVEDDRKPLIICRDEFVLYLNEEGYGILSPEILLNLSKDNCRIADATLSQSRFETSDVGEKEVVVTVTDVNGNEETCTTTVTVVPFEQGGSVVCTDSITLPLDENGEAELNLTYSGNKENIEVEVSKRLFTCEDIGSQMITATYYGEFTGSCDIEIVIVDELPPVVNCVSEINLILDENGEAEISIEDVNLGSTDNCEIYRMILSKSLFTTANLGTQNVQLTVLDTSGNSSYCEVRVNVKPYMATTGDLDCVEKLTVELDDNGEAILTAQELYAGDPAGVEFFGEIDFTCNDIGSHTITLSKKDDPAQSCEVEVEVVDNIPPIANCVQEIDLTLGVSGTASLSADDLDLNSSDNCGISQMSLSKSNFTAEDLGTQQITLSVIDGSGNPGTCVVRVNVLPNENIQPVECVDRHLIQIGTNGRAVLDPRDLFTGGSGTAQFTVSKDTFTCNELGENTITLNYETPDEQGSCEITVIVEDPENRCEVPGEPSGDYVILYPNPSLGLVRFQTSPDLIIHSIEIFDMRGRFIFEKVYNDELNSIFDYRLDLRKYQSGVYSLLIHTNVKPFLKRAIIKN